MKNLKRTPKTDQAFEGDPSVGVLPEIKNWKDAIEFSRQLERHLNTREWQLQTIEPLYKSAVDGWNNAKALRIYIEREIQKARRSGSVADSNGQYRDAAQLRRRAVVLAKLLKDFDRQSSAAEVPNGTPS